MPIHNIRTRSVRGIRASCAADGDNSQLRACVQIIGCGCHARYVMHQASMMLDDSIGFLVIDARIAVRRSRHQGCLMILSDFW
jgi:hypothetical protein